MPRERYDEYRALKSGLMSDLKHSSSNKHERGFQDEHKTEIFRTEFPMPEPPKPNFSSALYTSSNSILNDYQTSQNPGQREGYITTRSGLVYRSADSTVRALKELEIRRKEFQMKKKAGMLAVGLVLLALSIFNVTLLSNENASLRNAPVNANMMTGNGVEIPQSDEFNDQMSEEEITTEQAPLEEVIEEGKEFLQPFRYFADLSTPRRSGDSNFFFHIPRSGGQTIKDIAGKCLGKTLSSEVGVREGHDQDGFLQTVEIEGAKYVNVDTTSIDGLHRAANLGLASSNLSDLITSSYFGEVGMLFDLEHKGRAFAILRDPMERAVSMYYYVTRGEKAYLDPSITLEDYAQGNGIENNWVIRFLTGKMEGEVTKEHLEEAKEILSRKFLVGFMDDAEETVYRIMKYFDWAFDPDETKRMQQEECIQELITGRTNINEVEYEIPKRGSQANALIKWQTQFDIKLYEYAKELFESQTKLWGSKTRKKILRKKKKESIKNE